MITRLNLVFAFALALLPASAFADDAQKPGIVSVTGEGSAYLAPDMAVLTLTVMRQEETARAALDANNSAMAEVLASLRADDIEERDLQTSGFSIAPQYFYPRQDDNQPAQPVITGYRVSNTLTVRIREIDKLGPILDKSVNLGVNQGGQILFTNDDPSTAVSQARTAAVEDAMAKASTLAEAAGVSLGRIAEINEQHRAPRPMPIAEAAVMSRQAADASVPVATGENSYRVSVNVTFEIDQ
ncbi:MAG: SIMPL domain-containing protein [Pseudomonadota bacterium]